MGLTGGGSSAIHTVSGLSVEELRRLGLAVSKTSGSARTVPVLDIDASWLGYHLGTAKAGSVQPVIDIAIAHARDGFAVNLVTDSPRRFDWKLASWKRMADRAKAGIDAVMKRIRVNQIVCSLSNDNIGDEERAALLEEKRKLVSAIKSKEKNSHRAILDGFEDKLEQAVTDLNESAGGTFTTDRGGTVSIVHASLDSSSPSKGIASDRANLNAARDLEEQIALGGSSKEVAELKKLLQQLCEVYNDADVSLISDAVRKQFGLDIHVNAADPVSGSSKLRRTDVLLPVSPSDKAQKRKMPSRDTPSVGSNVPVVTFDISDDEVNRLTKFPSLQSMLAFIAIVCNGDADEMAKTVTKMAWFGEWFCYFEVAAGSATTRLRDAGKRYGCVDKVKRVYRSKLSKVLRARRRWPTYATMEEDAVLRDPKWNARYSDQLLLLCGTTPIST